MAPRLALWKNLACLLLPVGLGLPLSPAVAAPYGGAGGAFLRLGMDARPMGMANAYTAVAGDASAAYWNPAGLAAVDRPEVSGTYSFLPDSGDFSQFAFALPLSLFGFPTDERAGSMGSGLPGTLAFSLLHLAAAYDIEARQIDSLNPNYLFSDVEGCYALAFGLSLAAGITGGINVKGLYHFLDQEHAVGWGVDIGGQWQVHPGFKLGVAAKNAYASLDWNTSHRDKFPMLLDLGAAYQLPWEKIHGLLFSVEVEQALADEAPEIRAGAEYAWKDLLFIRMGYADGRPAMGAGVRIPWMGWARAGLKLDYAAEPDALEGWDHWFTLRLEL